MSENMDSPHDAPTDESEGSQNSTPEESTDTSAPASADSSEEFDRETIVTYLQWGALIGLAILALVAGAGLYSSLGAMIDVWIAPEYQPIARSGLNLALLAAAVAGIVAVVRRL